MNISERKRQLQNEIAALELIETLSPESFAAVQTTFARPVTVERQSYTATPAAPAPPKPARATPRRGWWKTVTMAIGDRKDDATHNNLTVDLRWPANQLSHVIAEQLREKHIFYDGHRYIFLPEGLKRYEFFLQHPSAMMYTPGRQQRSAAAAAAAREAAAGQGRLPV